MTTKEFFAKHYGSLSAGLFGLGLLAVLALYGGSFNSYISPPEQQTAPAQPETPPPQSEEAPPPQEQAAAPRDESAEPEKDPLEEAMAAEAAKAEERREAVREQIAKDREEAGLPALPSQQQTDAANGQ